MTSPRKPSQRRGLVVLLKASSTTKRAQLRAPTILDQRFTVSAQMTAMAMAHSYIGMRGLIIRRKGTCHLVPHQLHCDRFA